MNFSDKVNVTNTEKYTGKEVIQLNVSDMFVSVTRPLKD